MMAKSLINKHVLPAEGNEQTQKREEKRTRLRHLKAREGKPVPPEIPHTALKIRGYLDQGYIWLIPMLLRCRQVMKRNV